MENHRENRLICDRHYRLLFIGSFRILTQAKKPKTETRSHFLSRVLLLRSVFRAFKFGAVDGDLEGLMPQLMALNSDDYTRLILESSKEELIQEFE